MAISYLPGEPNPTTNAVDTVYWNDQRIVVYCSGNNLIILENSTTLLQNVYLTKDAVAVDIERGSGRIAVAYGDQVLVLNPVVIYGRPTRWEQFCIINQDQKIESLSWSSSDELVVGSIDLTLWRLPGQKIWTKRLANPAVQVEVSPDSCLIASVAKYDRLVKVWRRLSFDLDNPWFDFVYLPHPAPVTEFRWKKPLHASQTIENTLYTVCSGRDNTLRIWAPYDSMDSSNLQLWCSIDMGSPLHRFPLVVDNGELSRAIESSISRNETKNVIRLGQRQSELCVVIDTRTGDLTVYSIENIGLMRKQKRLARVTEIVKTKVRSLECSGSSKLCFKNFAHMPIANANSKFGDSPDTNGDLSILVHDMTKGELLHYTLELDKLLSPDPETWNLKSILTGHNKSVRRIMRSADGECLLSQSRFTENLLWKPTLVGHGMTMRRSKIVRDLVLWDCTSAGSGTHDAVEIARVKVLEDYEPMCFFLLPEGGVLEENRNSDNKVVLHLVAIYSAKTVRLWTVDLKGCKITPVDGNFSLPIEEELTLAAVVDPVGWQAKLSDRLDSFQRDVLTTISRGGSMRLWTALFEPHNETLEWLETSHVETGQKTIARAQASSTKKLVATDTTGSKLYIWDMRNRLLEYEEEFDKENNDTISDLDWTSSSGGTTVLGVGFAKEVMLYCELRFDYTNQTPSWAPFKRVDISQFTSHPIGDSIWLKNGTFVVGAGNQFFIQDEKVDVNDPTTKELLGTRNTSMEIGGGYQTKNSNKNKGSTIFDVCAVLNGPLPLYHPQLLIQSIFAEKTAVVKRILATLLHKLKFSPILEPSMMADIKSNLGLIDVFNDDLIGSDSYFSDSSSTPNGSTYEALIKRDTINADDLVFDNQKTCDQLGEWLQKVSLPYLTRHQQITLASVIEALSQTEMHRRSLDENGVKFLLGFKLYKFHRGTQSSMTMRDFNWALHSESQDILLEIVEKPSAGSGGPGMPPAMLWPQARDVGLPYWLNINKLTQQFEKIARNYFVNGGSGAGGRDPIACSLYYLALKKKQILVGLWRTATWHPEQAKTMKLLSNDFKEPRWRSAALKNAFALMGKHRFEYAAAFFLLGDSLKDAVNVLVNRVKDVALAIAVARVYEQSDHGPVLRQLIDSHVLPNAEQDGDRWTATWAYWITQRREQAVKCLVHTLLPSQKDAKSFLVDDPVLMLLYRFLRNQGMQRVDHDMDQQRLNGGSHHRVQKWHAIKTADEYSFVLKIASIYSRMGCDVLALDLVRSWKFVGGGDDDNNNDDEEVHSAAVHENKVNGEELQHQEVQKKKESELKQPLPEKLDTSAAHAAGSLKPAASQAFEEPDMSAFSFGF